MRSDQTPDAQDSVHIHFKTEHGDEALTVSKNVQNVDDLSLRQLQSVDLTPLSSCTSLQTLYLSENKLQKSRNTSDEAHVGTEEGSCIFKM